MARNQSTVYVGNLSEKVTEDLLYELFLQAGPVANVNIPSDRGRPKPFGFVQFKHPCSVPYALELLDGVMMFGKTLRLNLPKGAMMPGMPPMGLPMGPPMGLPVMPRVDLQPKLIHPLSVRGRLGPPMKPPNNYGRHRDDDDRHDSRDRHRSRRRDDMMPSSRPNKNAKDADDAPTFDWDSIPDLVDPFGPPMPSHGNPKSSHGPSAHGRRPYDDRGNRSHHDSRRDRHSHYPSNHRRHF